MPRTPTRGAPADARTVTLPREAVALLVAAAAAVCASGHAAWANGGRQGGLRHLWSLSDAIETAERALMEGS